MATSTGLADMRLANSPFLVAPSGGPVRLLVAAPNATVGLRMTHTAAVSVTFENPLFWGVPGVGAHLPSARVHLGGPRRLDGGGTAAVGDSPGMSRGFIGAEEGLERTECCTVGIIQVEVKPARRDSLDGEGVGMDARAEPATPLQIFVAVAGVEVVAPARRWEALLGVGIRLSGQLLPQLPAYPTHSPASASSLLVHLSLGTLTADLGGGETAGGDGYGATEGRIRVEALELDASIEQHAVKVTPPPLPRFLLSGGFICAQMTWRDMCVGLIKIPPIGESFTAS